MNLRKRIIKISIFGTFLFSGTVLSYEFSIKNAFCSDYASNRSNWTSRTYHYDYQKAYNHCLRNANSLIFEHEAKKKREIEKKKKIEKENIENARYQQLLKKRQENEKKLKLDALRRNIHSIFK